MRNLIIAAAALALIGAPAYAAATKTATNTMATKAAPKYDCTKKGNANKAACKTAAATAPASTPMAAAKPAPTAMSAKPAPAATPTPMSKPATAAMAPAKASTAGGSKMKACGAQWDALSKDQKAAYTTKGQGMKSKSGKPLSGYNAFSSECLKK